MHMNVFTDDAFSLVSMTEALDRMDFNPGFIGSLGLFTPEPIRTTVFSVEERDGTLALIPTSKRGAPISEGDRRRRRIRYFETTRIAKGVTIYADEVQNVRAFGSETELETAQNLVADRLTGPDGVMADLELTFERMRLGALQGIVLDADNTTIYNWYTEFGIAEPAAINFALTTATTDVRKRCADVIRALTRASKGAFGPGVTLHALCGDEFYDSLINHPTVRETYLNWQAAQDLRAAQVDVGATGRFGAFTYGGITFHNYRGTDDGSTVAIGTNDARLFPVGVRGMFSHVMAPAEFFDFVNTPGRRVYSMLLSDRDRNAWVRPEVYSYPMFVCKRPDLLRRLTRS